MYTSFLPARLRVGLSGARETLRAFRAGVGSKLKPVSQTRHPSSALAELREAAAAKRRGWLEGLRVEAPEEGARGVSLAREVYSVRLSRSGVLLQVPSHQTLLEAGRRAGVEMAFSCAMGGCGACKVRVLEGEVEEALPNCLSASEREAGERLACVSRPRSAITLDR